MWEGQPSWGPVLVSLHERLSAISGTPHLWLGEYIIRVFAENYLLSTHYLCLSGTSWEEEHRGLCSGLSKSSYTQVFSLFSVFSSGGNCIQPGQSDLAATQITPSGMFT